MVDSCDLNPLKCLNNDKCAVNLSSNMIYCQCDLCQDGIFFENDVFLIIDIIELCFSVLNKSQSRTIHSL